MPGVGKPVAGTLKYGLWTLNLFSGTTLTGIKECNGDPDVNEEEIFQQGQGSSLDPLVVNMYAKWNFTLTVEGGNLTTLAALRGVTLGAAGQYGLCMDADGTVTGYLERRVYDESMATLRMCEVIPDLIPRAMGMPGPMDRAEIEVPMASYAQPYILKDLDASSTKYPVAYLDTWTATDAQTVFPLTKTALEIDPNLNNSLAFFVKVEGVRQTSGFTIAGGNLTFDTGITLNEVVTMLYAYDSEA